MKANQMSRPYSGISAVILGCVVSLSFPSILAGEATYDSFGGLRSIPLSTTGRFSLGKIGDRHLLVTPEGHAMFSLGICHTGNVNDRVATGFNIFATKYGSNLENACLDVHNNLRQWGYNSLGYHNLIGLMEKMPHFRDISPLMTSMWRGESQFAYSDVFDPAWIESTKKKIDELAKTVLMDKRVIGVYWTDVPIWSVREAKGRKRATWIDFYDNLAENAPGKSVYRSFLEKGLEKEKFIGIIAKQYYRVLGSYSREQMPGVLLFGDRFADWDAPGEVLEAAAPFVDAISFQPSQINAEVLTEIHRRHKKPIMICDHMISFHTEKFPATNGQKLAFENVEAANAAHRKYLQTLFDLKFVVGYHRCMYINRMERGRLKQGLVDEEGIPHPGLVEGLTENHRRIYEMMSSETRGAK